MFISKTRMHRKMEIFKPVVSSRERRSVLNNQDLGGIRPCVSAFLADQTSVSYLHTAETWLFGSYISRLSSSLRVPDRNRTLSVFHAASKRSLSSIALQGRCGGAHVYLWTEQASVLTHEYLHCQQGGHPLDQGKGRRSPYAVSRNNELSDNKKTDTLLSMSHPRQETSDRRDERL